METHRRFGRTIENLALLVLLAVVGLRPLISETYDSARSSWVNITGGVEDPLPATTLMIDGVIMLAAMGWLAGRILNNDRRYCWCGIEWGAIVVGLAAGVSCVIAGNKRLAINGAVDWLSCVLLAIVLVQLLHDRWRIRLALCVVVASAGAQAVECFHQAALVYPETEAMYAGQRTAIWSREGVPLDSEEVELYEARMRAREATGYLSYSNVAGAYLVMCGLMAATVPLSLQSKGSWHPHRAIAWLALLLAAGILMAAALTKSRGALVAGVVSAGLYFLRRRFSDAWNRHGGAVFWWGWVVVGCFGIGVVGYGLVFKTLPGRSLGFRWRYWTASVRMVADHPLSGVGRGNFGRHYLKYKTIDSPEEITNPHNFLLAAATDWGLAGAGGLLAMILGVSRLVTCNRDRSEAGDEGLSENRAHAPPQSKIQETDRKPVTSAWWLAVWWGSALAAAIFLPRIGLLGSDDPNYRYFATMLPLLAWVVTFGVFAAIPIGDPSLLATGIGVALFGFLLQDTINFASLVPATLTTVLALLAIMLAERYVDGTLTARHTIPRPLACLWVGALVVVGFFVAVVGPVSRSGETLRQARRADATARAVQLYDEAAKLDPLDSQPPYECARLLWFMGRRTGKGVATLDGAMEHIDTAIERDVMRLALYREKSRYHLRRAELTGNVEDRSAAIAAAHQAVRLYPNDPAGHELLADCLAAKGRARHDPKLLKKAIDHYRRALAIDDARPKWETIRRLRPAKRRALAATISAVGTLMQELSSSE